MNGELKKTNLLCLIFKTTDRELNKKKYGLNRKNNTYLWRKCRVDVTNTHDNFVSDTPISITDFFLKCFEH